MGCVPLEHGLLCEAVGCLVHRLTAPHGIPQPPLSVRERTVLRAMDDLRTGRKADALILAAIEDFWRGLPFRMAEHDGLAERR